MIQDDCVNGMGVELIHGKCNSVNIYFESFSSKPLLSLLEYVALIRFSKEVEEINFDFVKNESEDFIQDLLRERGVREAM